MAEVILSAVLNQLANIVRVEVEQEVRLVVDVDNEVEELTDLLKVVQAVVEDAEKRQVSSEVVKLWLQDLKHIMYDADDVLDEWFTWIAISKAQDSGVTTDGIDKVRSYLSSLWSYFQPDVLRVEIAHRIRDIKNRLENNSRSARHLKLNANQATEYSNQPRNFTSSIYDASEIKGREDDKQVIVGRLFAESSNTTQASVSVISVVGMGGLGKTTLAQLIYNDRQVVKEFELRMWVCVSEIFDRERLAKEIVQQATGGKPDVIGWEALHQLLSKAVEGKKFLLILDDVWSEDYNDWNPLKNSLYAGAPGSRILVTTRNKKVAIMMGSIYTNELKGLSEEDCWWLFQRIAFWGRSEDEIGRLEEIGRELAKKCKGVPLAAKTLASRMRFEKTKRNWQNVLKSDLWEAEQDGKGLFPALLLSYQALRPQLKQCFMYTAIFPEDAKIEKDMLVKLWMAQGFLGLDGTEELEIVGEECFDDLSMRSFFQEFKEDNNGVITCKMHDLVREFAQLLTKTECSIFEKNDADFNSNKVRHMSADAKLLGDSRIYEGKKLRTLIKFSYQIATPNLFKIFHKLKCVRALDLSRLRIKELPDEIGSLLHLRYLDLSSNDDLEELPETMCNLYNLQTLKLHHCIKLGALPQAIDGLLNLRHLELDLFHQCVPKNIRKLSQLRTLYRFVVGAAHESSIEQLGSLNHLSGSIQIEGLDKVENEEQAETAKFHDKENLLGLGLSFNEQAARYESLSDLEKVRMESVLKGLQPHENLEKLSINYYSGLTFPPWMLRCDSFLPNIVNLVLYECRYCIQLPPALGKLKYLDTLRIIALPLVKDLSAQLLGVSNAGPNGASSSSGMVLFPKLRILYLNNMEEWEVEPEEAASSSIMPCLQILNIENCPKLKGVPHYMFPPSLTRLKLSTCPQLAEGMQPSLPLQLEELEFGGDVGVFTRSLSSISITQNNNDNYPNLMSLVINGSPHLSLPQGLNNFTSLQKLAIYWCKFLDLKPEEELRHFPMLQELFVCDCTRVTESCSKEDWRSTLANIPYNIKVDNKEIAKGKLTHQ